MKKIPFISKAKNLINLKKYLKNGNILPVFYFTVEEYKNSSEKILNKIILDYPEQKIIVRSSSLSEDSAETSGAGHYTSTLNINTNNRKALKKAIETTISSYDIKQNKNEVLIQPMLKNIVQSGVAFTADIDTLAPYFIINYVEGDNSEVITGGLKGKAKTFIHFKEAPVNPKDKNMQILIESLKEIEELFGFQYLDVEFAFDNNERLYIFQVRPIIVKDKDDLSKVDIKHALFLIESKIKTMNKSYPDLFGTKTIFGMMPDWNPAEIIGAKPKKLAISLYKELITDNIWAYQRDNYGYRRLRSHPLMHSIFGIPFIDVRVDFNSFIPKRIHNQLAEKLVCYYMEKLENNPELHDKVEFDVVFSCYYFNLGEKLEKLKDKGFTSYEIKNLEFSLLEMTNEIIHPKKGLYKSDLEKIEILSKCYSETMSSDIGFIEKIYWLTENCKRYGTLPFAGIARAAFIAMQFLKSFKEIGIISNDDYEKFMRSHNTISRKISKDYCDLSNKKISKEEFLKRYGHLRPGTYDITSPRYDESFENYFSNVQNIPDENNKDMEFKFSDKQINEIENLIIQCGIFVSARELIQFIRETIEGREYAKFIFTRSLSKIIQQLEILGKHYGFSKDDMAYFDFKLIQKFYSEVEECDIKELIQENINKNKHFYKYTKALKLPELIINEKDIYSYYLDETLPNYITLKKVQAETISTNISEQADVKGKIVFIQSADPGFDFLFTKGIAGLITQFGGANSHMAIRCAELGIPAVIGAGEKNYQNWSNYKILFIDSANHLIRKVR